MLDCQHPEPWERSPISSSIFAIWSRVNRGSPWCSMNATWGRMQALLQLGRGTYEGHSSGCKNRSRNFEKQKPYLHFKDTIQFLKDNWFHKILNYVIFLFLYSKVSVALCEICDVLGKTQIVSGLSEFLFLVFLMFSVFLPVCGCRPLMTDTGWLPWGPESLRDQTHSWWANATKLSSTETSELGHFQVKVAKSLALTLGHWQGF